MTVDVSIIVVNFNGKQFLDDCLPSLFAQTYPADKIEVVVVDNGSSDGSQAYLAEKWPKAVTVRLKENRGFAGGVNEGVRRAKGHWVALINNDAKADPYWIEHGLQGFKKGSNVAMVGSKIVSLDGNFIDYAGGALSFYGHGFKIGVNEKDFGQYDRAGETLFASGCALLMPKELFLRVGGFDEDFFAFFEDVDLGWRLWALGYRITYEPSSFVYHRHHGTAAGLSRQKERFLLERNALLTMIKNLETQNLHRLLPASLFLSLERGLSFSDLEAQKYDLAKDAASPLPEEETINARTAAHLLAISEVARAMPSTLEKRRFVQENRSRSDREIVSLFKSPLTSNYGDPAFMKTYDGLVEGFGVREVFEGRSKVLLITADTVSAKMAGPAIRAWEMCSELSRKNDVIMLAKAAGSMVPKGFKLELLKSKTLGTYLQWADVVIFQGFIMHNHSQIARCGKVLVADLYDPFHLENLEMFRGEDQERRGAMATIDLQIINEQLEVCDFFICASEKQRDFWLGQLAGVGRLNPLMYDSDPTLKSLIDIVPFGISSDPPIHTENVLKGVVEGIKKTDKVILWGGGIYNWFDPLTLIKAMAQIHDDHPEVKLFFLGMSHPNPDVPQMQMATAAVNLAQELSLENVSVFFNRDWVPYEQRGNYLLECDIGVSCHLEHIETTYSYRTRVLDYFWAEMPVIVTRGDALSQLVHERSLGLTVAPGDVDGFATAIRRMIEDEDLARECSLNVGKLRPELSWAHVIEPLDRFCSNPAIAADKLRTLPVTIATAGGVGRLAKSVGRSMAEGGPSLVIRRTADYVGKKLKGSNP